jgi:hypothetical protein
VAGFVLAFGPIPLNFSAPVDSGQTVFRSCYGFIFLFRGHLWWKINPRTGDFTEISLVIGLLTVIMLLAGAATGWACALPVAEWR